MLYYYNIIKKFVQDILKYRVSLYAANASFYIILAFFPSIMLLVSLMPAVGFSHEDLLGITNGIVPEILTPLIERIIKDMTAGSTVTLMSVTAFAAVWSSSRGVYYIQVGIHAICGGNEKRSYLFRRLMSMVYMILLLIALLLTLFVLGFGQEVALFLAKQSIPVLNFIAEVMQFRGLILLILLSLLFCVIYCVFPSRRVSFRKALPGAVLAALGWLVFTLGFSIYARYFSNYSVLYGSLSIIAFGMLWLYVCISILFYGCVLNQYLDEK